MATNFPGSLDAFTNPTSGDTLDNPPHDQQHADINDAVEAIETALLDGAPLHIDDANERVGIGTATPAHPLHVTGSDNRPIRAESSVSGSYIDIQDSATTGEGYVAIGAVGNEARIIAGGSTRVTVDSSGNVGINDTTPSYTLDVNGDINATGDLRIGGAAIGTYTDYSSSVTFGGFTKGTSTVVAKYARVGKFVHYWGYVITHSGFSMTGPLDVSLPIAATGGILTTNSPCSFYDGSTITWGTAINLGGSTMRLVTHAAGGTYAFNADVASNVPFTWATGDAFYWNHYYEAA